jgi:hypothetical protein
MADPIGPQKQIPTEDQMPKKPASFTPRSGTLTLNQSITILKELKTKAEALLAEKPIASSKKQAWEVTARHLLEKAFGPQSENMTAIMDVNKYNHYFGGGTPQEYEDQRVTDMEERVQILDGLIDSLELEVALANPPNVPAPDRPSIVLGTGRNRDARMDSKKVFLVHGHDDKSKHEVARFIERLKLEPIILHEQPNAGRTIIEKFEAHADVGFAVILMTADDRGGPKASPYEQQELRARQNVILELGFFLGALGRDRVCALRENDVEIPSDYNGVVYTILDPQGAWKLDLVREMKQAALPGEWNATL